MELKEGMYVRTKWGYICELININDFREPSMKYGVEANYLKDIMFIGDEDIVKASNNIIDLIEEDDLIKCQFGEQTLILQVGARYTTLHQVNDWVKGVFTPDNEFWSLKYLYEEDILQSIVTKEQFKAMEYVVGDSDE